MPSLNKYVPFYTQVFFNCLEQHRDKQDRIFELVERICRDPKVQSHFLKKQKGIDLRGKRRRHMSGNYVVIYIVCEECIAMGHKTKGHNNCHFCSKKQLNWIIFLAFDKWDDIYSRKWNVIVPNGVNLG